jgi:hypothetical protein
VSFLFSNIRKISAFLIVKKSFDQISRQKPLFVTHFKTYNPYPCCEHYFSERKKVTQRSKHKQN